MLLAGGKWRATCRCCLEWSRSAASPAAASLRPLRGAEHRRRATAAAAAAVGAGGSMASGGGGEEPVVVTVAFKSAAVQQQFAESFQQAQGVDATVVQLPHGAEEAAAAAAAAGAGGCSFDAGAFFRELGSERMGHALLAARSVPSTQEFMRAHAASLPEGAVLVADRQTRGKGRGGNQWTSPDGCLMFTALRRLAVPGAQAPFINYVVCLAVVRGIKEATQGLVQGGLDVQVKWPNDIYHGGVKVGGALIHTTWTGGRFCVLTGIGLNVSNSQPTTCLDDIVARQLQQQQQQQQRRVCKEQLLAAVLTQLESCFDTFEARGFDPLKPQYLGCWMHGGQTVELDEGADAGGAGGAAAQGRAGRVALRIAGLSPHGFLLAVDALGQEYELTPDGNSLDMMQGLIRKKL